MSASASTSTSSRGGWCRAENRPAPPVDPAAVEAFAGRFLDTLDQGALVLMTSIGHRVGLFDAMAAGASGTSDEIARATGLNERYVREWLAAMTAAGVVELRDASHHSLPPERAAVLARGSEASLALYSAADLAARAGGGRPGALLPRGRRRPL